MKPERVEPCLLTRDEAAAYLGISLSTFKRHVQPYLPFTPVGTLKKYDQEDLDEWRATRKVGKSSGGAASRASGSGTKLDATKSPLAREILAKLEKPPRGSTPKLSLVRGGLSRG